MSNNFIIEEFKHYKVSLYGRKGEGLRNDYSIQFRIPSGHVVLRFTKDLSLENYYENHKHEDAKNFYVYLRVDKYPAFIDIFRYEKPLFFYYNLDTNQAYVTTSDEPVGEEESSSD